ncbi:CDR ABC transporter [Phytophthora cactorum]|nr:CDR ABC transporter [Phytophthora cactorum]
MTNEYLEDVFLMKHSEIWRNCAIVLAFLVFFRVLTLLAMRFVNHQKR